MKFLAAFVTLLFATAILPAQVPYGGTLQPYYPGAIAQPYFPQPYYPQPYFPQPYFVQSPYNALGQMSITQANDEIDTLTRRVEQLNAEVVRLQTQLAAVQVQPAPAPVEPSISQPEAPSTPVALVFKDGKQIDAQGYAVVGQTLWIFNPSGSQRVALSQLDMAATKTENQKRGIHFSDSGN
jgi:hypothetical protein